MWKAVPKVGSREPKTISGALQSQTIFIVILRCHLPFILILLRMQLVFQRINEIWHGNRLNAERDKRIYLPSTRRVINAAPGCQVLMEGGKFIIMLIFIHLKFSIIWSLKITPQSKMLNSWWQICREKLWAKRFEDMIHNTAQKNGNGICRQGKQKQK